MEPLPTQGETLRHYTASRPRPRRTHTQPPSSRHQDPLSKVEHDTSEGMGRVDEGVEEFFTKKIIPDYALKGRWEESDPVQSTPTESSSTLSALTPLSSLSNNITFSTIITVTTPSDPSTDTSLTSTELPLLSTSSTPPPPSSVTTTTTTLPTKNIKKKFGDFFAFKRVRAGRAPKAGGGDGGDGVKVKRTSIADLIRPLREAKERERERERDKEREKGRGASSVEDDNVSNDATTTEGTIATSHHLAGDVRGTMATAKTLTTMTPPRDTTSSFPTINTSHDLTTISLSNLEEEAVFGPMVTPPLSEQEKSGGTPYGERRLKVTKRSLREGKSQSLILLTGLEPEDKDGPHSKKCTSESSSSFEHRLQVMLHRMGVAKTAPADTKTSQTKDDELRKANSEGAILDKPKPPTTYMKPRTMSTSADPRHPMRALDHIRPDPPLHPKPTHPECPAGPLPPKPAIAAKPLLPTPAAPAGGAIYPSSGSPSSTAERVQFRPHPDGGSPAEVKNGSQVGPQRVASSPRKDLSPWRGPSTQDRSEKAQSVTYESLSKPRHHMKPIPQRRAVSVHEDALAMTQELKAVLQRSPIRHRGTKGDLPVCTEDPSFGKEAQRGDRVLSGQHTGKESSEERKDAAQKEQAKIHKGSTACGETPAESKHHPPGVDETPNTGCASSSAQAPQQASKSPLFSPDKAPSIIERPPALTQTQEKSHITPTSKKKSPSTVPAFSHTSGKWLMSPPEKISSTIRDTIESVEPPQGCPLPSKKKNPGAISARISTHERGETLPEEHTTEAGQADQRTEYPLSESDRQIDSPEAQLGERGGRGP